MTSPRDGQTDQDPAPAHPPNDEAPGQPHAPQQDDEPTEPPAAREEQPPAAPPRPDFATDAPPAASAGPTIGIPLAPLVALGLWLASAVAGAVAVVLSLLNQDQVRAAFESTIPDDPQLDEATIDTLLTAVVYATVAAVGFGALLMLLLTIGLYAQRNWARILLVVTAVLNLPVVLFALSVFGDIARIALAVEVVLSLAAVVIMFLPPNNAWIRARDT